MAVVARVMEEAVAALSGNDGDWGNDAASVAAARNDSPAGVGTRWPEQPRIRHHP